MKLQLYVPDGRYDPWLAAFRTALPEAALSTWSDTAQEEADYAVVWKPPIDMLRGRRDLKAIFNMGAGVDGILRWHAEAPGALPANVPIIRLDDAGMSIQMVEYVTHAVLRHFRRFDAYDMQQREGRWKFARPYVREDFHIGVMGLGVLGTRIASALVPFGFPVRGWSRTPKQIDGVTCHAGTAQQDAFLDGLQVLVNILPLTPETDGILNAGLMRKLRPGAHLINIGRGDHLVEEDLLEMLRTEQLSGATLDVFRTEPLPAGHPFWQEPRITITPHISAMTLRDDTVVQIARKIRALEAGEPVAGVVDLARGY
ncbi:glyoxylate/hydroxypyruvate reductase A [Imbroritus primus]|uniref:Glyoxylate/hydroxypyruvate reductase A n=1 Tax=Imbroritus primus TaxID=3058603 RepID=A0ACD3SLJ4_9BURK|nr:glyoxylate/hydroxypyruvate reductase A [Burkholderiaceae bacterium PBA]